MTPTRRGLAIAFAVYCAITCAMFPRLILHAARVLPNDLGDPLLSVWILWWNAHHLPFTAAWWDGLFFYPMHGALALSDHRVGLGLIASPIQWLGGSPVLAYNVTLLLTFPLSALAAHALARRVTRSDAGAFVAGLIFGFNPYRMSHIQHLELLAAFWLPVAILAMHAFIEDGSVWWLGVFAAALVLQGLSSGYYLLYAAPFIAAWIVWFAWRAPRRVAGLLAAGLVGALTLAPVLLHYRDVQDRLGLSRNDSEIEIFGADVAALVSASPLITLWHSPPMPVLTDETHLFPGVVALALMIVGVLQRPEQGSAEVGRILRVVRIGLAIVASVFALGAVRAAIAPGPLELFGLTISNTRVDKAIDVVVAALLLLGATSSGFRGAFARRSRFAFYAAATFALWLFALGPVPKLLGHPVMSAGPYRYLMALPGYDHRLRVPARFAMIAILTLSIAAALATAHAIASASRRRSAVFMTVVCGGILAGSWIGGLSLPEPPAPRPILVDASRVGSMLELPLGGDLPDTAALYQSMFHGRPVVNGYSGYDPHHYQVLRLALTRGDDSVFDVLAAHGPVLVRVDSATDTSPSSRQFMQTLVERLAQRHGVSRVKAAPGFTAFLMPAVSQAPLPSGASLRVRAISATSQEQFVRYMIDGDPTTRWGSPSTGDDEIDIELDGPHRLTALSLTFGEYVMQYPRALAVSTSLDGSQWTEVWRGPCGGMALRAVLDDARMATMMIPLAGTGRFVRVRQLDRDDLYAWSLSELAVLGGS